jgi:polar amino acid transport system ATP-binding protein
MTLVEIDGVTKRYGPLTVLDGISLDVDEHEVVCLIGASGSGKSTLLRCTNALETIDGGEIRLSGDVISGRGVAVNELRQRVGIVFQSYNLFPNLSVIDNVTLAPRRVGRAHAAEARDRGQELLERVGLGEKARAYPHQLSGGQQQRVAIVRALAMRPELLLLDEVTSALDPELVAEVLRLIRDLADDGMTMVLATHEMSFAREVAHKVCFLCNGVILEQGPPEEIFSDPHEPATRAFLRRVVEANRL